MNESSATRKAALWVGLVFVLGVALGGVLGFNFAHHRVLADNPPQSEPERRARRVEQLTRELNLNDAQQKQLDTILAQVHAEYKSIHDKSDAEIQEERNKARNEIRAILTPEQKPKYEEWLVRLQEEVKRNAPPNR